MDPLTIYFIFQADYIQGFIMALTVACGVVTTAITFVAWLLSNDPDGEIPVGSMRFRNACFIAFFPLALLAMFTPTTDTLIKTWGVYTTIQVAQENEELGKLPDNMLKYLNTYFENEIEEMQGKSSE
jgi:hypothetical protein